MRTVCLVTQFYAPERVGTAFYTHDLAQAIDGEHDWNTRVVTGEPYYPEFRKHVRYRRRRIRNETLDGINVDRLRTYVPKDGTALGRVLSELNFLLQVVIGLATGRLRRHQYVISFSPGLFSVLAGRVLTRSGGRHLTVVHDVVSGLAGSTGLVPGPLASLIRRVETRVLSQADVVAVLSDQMGETLRRMDVRSRVVVVPLWIREELFDLEGPVRDLPKTPTALYSGNLGRKQGLDRIIDAADRIQCQLPEAQIVIRGSGPMRSALERAVAERRLGNVTFEDLVAGSELQAALEDSWVHLAPQDPGGAAFSVPSKVINALAVGRPVLVTTEAGTPLHDLSQRCPAVISVPPDDPERLTEQLATYLSDARLCIERGREGRRFVRAHRRRDEQVSRLLELLADGWYCAGATSPR